MAGLYAGAFLGMLSETSMSIALPSLCDSFSITTGTAQWVVVGYMLAISVVLPCVGFLLKWFKTKSLILFALACFLLGAVLDTVAPSFVILLLGRILQGISTGIVLPTMFAVILRIFPPTKIGAANGIAGLVVMFAPVIGPTLAGLLIGMFSWRVVFAVFALISVLAIILTACFFSSPIEQTKPKVDFPSILASAIGFGSLVAGVCLVADYGLSALVITLLALGIVVLAFYVFRQLRITNPLLDLRPLAIRSFRIPALMVTASFSCTLTLMFIAPQQLQVGMGLASELVGVLMLAGGVFNAVFSYLSGRLFDRTGAKVLVWVGAGAAIVGSALFLLLGTNTAAAWFVLAHVVFMIGIPLMQQSAQSAALKGLPGRMAADGSTILNTLQQVAGAIATSIATILLAFGQSHYQSQGGTNLAEGFVTGARFGYLFGVVLILIPLLLSFKLREEKPAASTPKQEA